MKRLMTLTDLYEYYAKQNQNLVFCSSAESDEISVQIPSSLTFESSSAIDGLYPVDLSLCFVGDNLNNSRIETKGMKNALKSAKHRPVLAYIHEVDGEPQFYGHNMHQDVDGNIVYDEVPVGVISEEAKLKYNEEYQKDFAVAKGYIYEEYSKAAEILRRDGKCDASVELAIRSLSYNSEDKILVLDDFYFSGITLLGMDDGGNIVNPAMPGSGAQGTVDLLYNNARKEDNEVDNEEIILTEEEAVDEVVETEVEEEVEDFEAESEAEQVDESEEEVESEVETEEEFEVETQETSTNFSITSGELVRNFAVSMSDVLYSLSTLVNETYESDGTYYSVDAYPDDKTLIMVDYMYGKAYKQSYKVKKDVYTLVGDRVPVKAVYVTADEEARLDEMRSKYSLMEVELEKYKAEPQKMEILESEDYSKVFETDEYKELLNDHFNMSTDEVQAKADQIILEYVKSGKLDFATVEGGVAKKRFSSSKKVSRYGNLFK